MKVKVCGLTNKEDAIWAVNYGADYLGINFWSESPRHVSLASAKKWVPELPPFAAVFGVFVNASPDEVVKHAADLKLKGVQLHGDENADYIEGLKQRFELNGQTVSIMKAVRVQNEQTLEGLPAAVGAADYLLIDAWVENAMGGTGQTFNWDLAVKTKELGKPIFLAGGLKPDNVKQAVKKVAPFAVDVASGIEKSPKRKDVQKMQEFIRNAKG